MHRTLHTFVGAAIAGVVTAGVLLAIRALVPRLRRSDGEAGVRGIVAGAMLGALTHPVLDGIMHGDIEPFLPWSTANPLHGLISLTALHLGCLVCGLAGACILVVRRAVAAK